MTEAKTTDSFKAIVAIIVAVLSTLTDALGLAPGLTDPYFVGLIVSGGSSLIALWYAIRHIRAGAPVQGELPL